MVFSTFLCRAFTAHYLHTPRSCDIPTVSFHGAHDRCSSGSVRRARAALWTAKNVVFAAPKDVGQDLAGVVIDGMPEPAGVAFVADKRPHLIHLRLRFPSALQV